MTTKAEQFVASVTTQDSNAIYAALEAAAALGDVTEDQDWEAGASTWIFDDMSSIVMEGSQWRITSRPDSPSQFVAYANELLESLGIGTYDNGQRWCEYTIDDDGNVYATDYSDSIKIDWRTESDDDIRDFANAYLEN